MKPSAIAVAGLGLLQTISISAVSQPSAPPGRPEISAAACGPVDNLRFICGVEHPEDLAHIPDTRWLIASGFSDGAGLKLIDTANKTMRFWYSGNGHYQKQDKHLYGSCPSPPDPSVFNAHGISLRRLSTDRFTLLVVNHGGRESIEVFTVDTSAEEPTLIWTGCVLLPQDTAANSVASYADGTILTSVLTRPGTTITDFVNGKRTGAVYEWKPGQSSFRLLHGTELPGNNGLETSRDDRSFYVVAFGWHSVLMYSRADPSKPIRKAIAPGFMPDNIHWDADRLIAAGMVYDEPACGGTRRVIGGKADDMRCHRGYMVAQVDPQTLTFSTLAYAEPNSAFNGVSAAVVIGNELWLGSYQADRIAYRLRPGALAAVASGK